MVNGAVNGKVLDVVLHCASNDHDNAFNVVSSERVELLIVAYESK